MLKVLLDELCHQEHGDLFGLSVVVVDNDMNQSAKQVVADFVRLGAIPTSYHVEPITNIALARNKAVESAVADYLAFIDDDEVPCRRWLQVLLAACEQYKVAGVLGPVHPRFETSPPRWLTKAGFYQRPTHETGFQMSWNEARTGNVLIRRAILQNAEPPFRPEFGTGGEDQDFFRRMINHGHTFIWCNEAPVFELVPPHRWKRRFLLKRALLRGKTSFRHRDGRAHNIAKSCLAVPLYGMALPFLFIMGHHFFMKYFVRLFDHVGRLLALFNLNPVHERCN